MVGHGKFWYLKLFRRRRRLSVGVLNSRPSSTGYAYIRYRRMGDQTKLAQFSLDRPDQRNCIHPEAAAAVCVCTPVALIHIVAIIEPRTRVSELSRRRAIVMALRAGSMPPEIIRMLNLPRRTVYRVAKAFSDAEHMEEGSYTGARKSHVRRRSKLSPKLVDAIRRRISCDVRSSHLDPKIGRGIQS